MILFHGSVNLDASELRKNTGLDGISEHQTERVGAEVAA
jgi:hypothetical protein